MKWKQFFRSVDSLNAVQADAYITEHPGEKITILDVRQPSEYKESHIPGAQLIPLGQLTDRLSELDPEKPTLVYCAIGGRSRVAAQMLSGKGFKKVINVSGGIKAWHSKTAIGAPDLGMELFTGKEAPRDVLTTAYSLEQGLREFYLTMEKKAVLKAVKDLFGKLAEIELHHQASIVEAYNRIEDEPMDQAAFERLVETDALEGGMTTREYLDLFKPDLNSPVEVISLAMSIEAQALDLYQRAALSFKDPESKAIVQEIANEEKTHIASLGKLLDRL